MGFFKKVFKPVRKIAKKIIPKEIRPFLPYIAAAFGPAGLAGTKFAAMNPAFQKAILAGVTSAATDEQGDPLRAAALAAAPDVLSQGLGNIAGRIDPNIANTMAGVDVDAATQLADTGKLAAQTASALSKASEGIKGASTLKTIGAQTAVDQAAKFAEINQDEIDKYNEELRKQGVLDKTKRRTSILNIYLNAGYEPEYVNSMLDRYGYESGGRIGFANGGYRGKAEAAMGLTTMKDLLKGKRKAPIIEIEEDEEVVLEDDDDRPIIKREPKYAEAMKEAMKGVEAAFGIPFGGVAPAEFKRFARGGEVEIEEETDDLGIMDLMRDQGIEYGEQVSAPGPKDGYDDIARQLFGKGYKDLTPEELEMFQEELERLMNKFRSGMDDEGIMKMASGYKTDIEEMYEQYVFEMEEQGLTPMSFAAFLRQARAGMADGGDVHDDNVDDLGPGKNMLPKDHMDKMPTPQKMDGIMEAADGGIMEKDMRGGGFIPEGSKERADDVPARLSKNEFVMTADAVRAAGGGSVNKGAKRMYDMMYNLEGKV